MTDLGYANDWDEEPEIVQKCTELGHDLASLTLGRCLTEYTCEECDYFYLVDSSD